MAYREIRVESGALLSGPQAVKLFGVDGRRLGELAKTGMFTPMWTTYGRRVYYRSEIMRNLCQIPRIGNTE